MLLLFFRKAIVYASYSTETLWYIGSSMLCDELLEKVGDCMQSGYMKNASVGR